MSNGRLVAVAVLLAAVGCNSGRQYNGSRQPMSSEKFELVKEPAINVESRFAAGQLAESRGDFKGAARQYEEALRLDGRHRNSLNRLAVVYAMSKQPEKSIAAGKRYVSVADGAPEAWNNLAQCYEYAGIPEEAEAAYRAGVEKDPNNIICRTNYGLLLVRQGRVDAGREQMAIVLPPAEVHYNVGSIFEMQGNKSAARIEYTAALRVDPKFYNARKRIAKLD